MMKTSKLILLCLLGMTVASITASAQERKESLSRNDRRNLTRSEKKARTERAVKRAIDSRTYKINVNRMQPMRGSSRTLTTDYSVKVRNDSVHSYLPYFGVAYNIPYGGGKGLVFSEPITEYKTEKLKKGRTRIEFKTRSEGYEYQYSLTVYPNGSTTIHVQPSNRQAISYTGEVDIKEE